MNNVRRKVLGKASLIVLVTVLISSAIAFFDLGSFFYRASVLDLPAHLPFDGTVYPVQKSLDWVHIGDKRDYTYSQLSPSDFQNLPYYDPAQLIKSTDGLQWNNAADNLIRNAKITYSTPYMGSYELNGKEYVGSHLAVDIKIPEGTPVFAIANGTVIKASTQNAGFGQHVVLVHNNVPGQSGPIYSSYSHNSGLLVSAGETVKKGQQIAISGSSGTATTPHLHFQIDNDSAPWHPFWPFTWKEANDAGLSFFAAVNAALGQDRAIATTLNPMKFVQDHLDGSAVVTVKASETVAHEAISYVSDDSDSSLSAVIPVETVATVEAVVEAVIEEVVVEDAVEAPVVVEAPVLKFEFEVKDVYMVDEEPKFVFVMKDQFGNDYKNAFEGEIVIESVQGNVRVSGPITKWSDFGGISRLSKSFSKLSHGRDRLKVLYAGETYYSEWFSIFDPEKGFTDISEKHKYYEPIMFLKDKNIVGGYSDGTYQSKRVVSRVEASKFIVAAAGLNLKNADIKYPFPDVIDGAWYLNYVFTLYDKGVINGNSDGTLKPDNDVNKAEFIKMLFLAMGENVRGLNGEEAWYVPYIEKAEDLNIMKNVDPGEGMTRGEVADAIWRVMTK